MVFATVPDTFHDIRCQGQSRNSRHGTKLALMTLAVRPY